MSGPTAYRILRLLRRAMADRDRSYWLSGLIEVDDALVGGRRSGKRGRGAEGGTPVLLAVENHGRCAGYLAAQALPAGLNQAAVRGFVRLHIGPEAAMRSVRFAVWVSAMRMRPV